MDGVFSLPEATRADFLRSLMQSFGCAYICLWQPYDSPLSNRLFFLDGVLYNNDVSNSAAVQSLFNLYQRLIFYVNDERVPGIAFRNHMPYLELQRPDLLKLASPGIQTQFYQEARIETAIVMGCSKGEIELGFSMMHQIDIQAALSSLFPEDFSRLSQQLPIDYHHQSNINLLPSSSNSSSWRTLSTGSHSPECSSLLMFSTVPPAQGTSSQSYFPPDQTLVPNVVPTLAQFIPTLETEQEAIIKAISFVISSTPPPSSTSHRQHQNLPNNNSFVVAHNPEASAFKMYNWPPDHITPPPQVMGSNNNNNIKSPIMSQSLMKRSIAFSRSLHLMRMRERFQFQAARPIGSSQLNHLISERTRREKINEIFQALRALLPPGTKNVKASILIAAKETLKSLIAEIEKLNMRNQQLTTLLSSSSKEATSIQETNNVISSSNERLNVRVSDVPGPSSSEERMVDLQVILRSAQSSHHRADIVIRLLEFLKRVQNVRLVSMDANIHITQDTPINQLNFRLRIVEGSDWDESAFEEAVRRVVADHLIQF